MARSRPSGFSDTEIQHEEEDQTMRYIQPKITGTFPAVSTIRNEKNSINTEQLVQLPTTGNAYQADE